MSIGKTLAARPWILALIIIMAVVVWMYTGASGKESATIPVTAGGGVTEPETVQRVKVATQQAEPIIRYISVYGRSAPVRTVEVNAETSGRVVSIGVERGQRVKKGEVIARLDLRDRQARLEQAKASVNEYAANYKAQLELKSSGYVSEAQIAEIIAKLEGAKVELVRAKLDLDYMVIRAPFDGVLESREVEIGDFVRAGDAIATVVDNTRLIVTATLSEQDAQHVSVGDDATAILVTGQEVSGKIRYIAPVADLATRTFAVELEVPNPDGSLPAGVTSEIRIAGGTVMAHRISPSLLNLDTEGEIGIKVVDDEDKVIFYPVEIARSQTNGIWVSGLPETARIITVGQGYVLPGQRVIPVYAEPGTALAAGRRP